MNIRYFVCALAILGALTTQAQAAHKKAVKKKPVRVKNKYFRLLEAYSQKAEKNRAAPPQTGTHFIIVWSAATYPETFFWRGDNGWLNCRMERAKKATGKHAAGVNYVLNNTSAGDIHAGDTLMLSPITGGKFPIPAEIPADVKNMLFFKTGGSQWLSYPVNVIAKK